MIQAFIGEDTFRARKAAREAYNTAKESDENASIAYFNDLSFEPAQAIEALGSENLFGGGNIVFLDGILDHPEGETLYRTALKEGEHTVIIRESSPPKDLMAFFQRMAEVHLFPAQKKVEKYGQNFVLADACVRRDRRSAWVEFEKIRRSGAPMEELHGSIFWAFKSLFLVAVLSKPEALEAGVKEGTYRNYSAQVSRFSVLELKGKLGDLKEMYHRAHRGEGELDILMEQFMLSL